MHFDFDELQQAPKRLWMQLMRAMETAPVEFLAPAHIVLDQDTLHFAAWGDKAKLPLQRLKEYCEKDIQVSMEERGHFLTHAVFNTNFNSMSDVVFCQLHNSALYVVNHPELYFDMLLDIILPVAEQLCQQHHDRAVQPQLSAEHIVQQRGKVLPKTGVAP